MNIQKAVSSLFQNGYAVVPSFLSPQTCSEAVREIDALIASYNPSQKQMFAFTTKEKHNKNEYFLGSSDCVRFFFEEKAIVDGRFVKPKEISINKIGHALHEKNPLFSKITYQDEVQEICQRVGNFNPVVVQSMAILKPPEIGGEVPEHQDSTFLHDDPETLLAFWIPLQDATLKNGCLWGIPGSHKYKLYKRSKMDWKTGEAYTEVLKERDYKDEDFVPIEMQKGSMAMFTGRFIHKSMENKSKLSRYAYTWHLKDGRTQWSRENWLQREKFPDLPFKKKKIDQL